MNEEGERQGASLDTALAGLLGLARQILGSPTWLLLNSEEASSVLLDENGRMAPVTAFAGRELRSDWNETSLLQDLAASKNCCLRGSVAVGDEDNVHGKILLVAESPRPLADTEKRNLDGFARQVDLLLERDQLAKALKKSQAAERAVRESLTEIRGDLRLVTDQVLEVLCKTDLTGAIWLINPSAERELGYDQGTLIGRNVFDLIHSDERGRTEDAFREAAVMGRFDTEIRCQHRNGHYIHLVCSGTALLDDNLMPNGYLLAGRNISRRKKVEADLRRLEYRFKLVWEHSRDAMRLIDENGVVVQVNDEFCRLVNKPRDALVGKPFVVAYSYPDPEQKVTEFQERFANHTIPARLELVLNLWNGTRRAFDLSSAFFEVEDQTLLLTSYRDITERLKEEGELKRLNDALQQRAAYLGALTLKLTRVEQEERRRLAQILHDHLQQLLVAARMTMERVRGRIAPGEDADTAAEVEHLLDESIEASRSITIELSPPVLHDGGLIAAFEWLVRRVHEKHGLHVTLVADPEAEPPSISLRLFLFQAVRELLFNCYKHAKVTEVSLSLQRMDLERVQVTVKDQGAGFDFSSIASGAGSSRDCFGLFSLGERMSHLGGEMDIEAAPGQGTCVRLIVPLEPEVKMPPAVDLGPVRPFTETGCDAEADEQLEEGKIKLLLVDDHKIMRQGLHKLFRSEPDMLIVGEAENGVQGLRLAEKLQPDVVVMAINMPVMNGIEATRILTAEFPGIKIVGLSMHMKEDMAEAMLEAGACSYVTKAVASEALVGTIRACVRAKEPGNSAVAGSGR